MKILILCLLIGSIAAINQSNMDFQEVATSRASSGCIDRLHQVIQVHQDCKKLDLSCPRLKSTQKSKIWQNWLKSQCNKTLKQKVGDDKEDKKCLKRIKKKDANRKIYEFCAGSCQKCKPKATAAPKSTPEPKATPAPKSTPEPKPTPAPTSGVSLKENHKQMDIITKSIDDLREKLLSQDALLDNQSSLINDLKKKVSSMKGDLSEEKTIREKSDQTIQERVDRLENTAVRICSQGSDCAEPLPFCLNGWCSITECTENSHCQGDNPACNTVTGRCYNHHGNTYCRGDVLTTQYWNGAKLESAPSDYSTLSEATEACNNDASCGCVLDDGCDGKHIKMIVGTGIDYWDNSCSWVKV